MPRRQVNTSRGHMGEYPFNKEPEVLNNEESRPVTSDEVQSCLKKLRETCLSRGASGIKEFGRRFRQIDDNGSRCLDKEEFKKGIEEYDMSPEEANTLFRAFDEDGSGQISFEEFLMHLRPPMSKCRQELIKKAFIKMDKSGDGVVTTEDLKNVYDVINHPKFKSGEWTKARVLQEFLKSYEDPNDADGTVTEEEFINYYAGVSASIDQDVYFDYMMRQCWKL